MTPEASGRILFSSAYYSENSGQTFSTEDEAWKHYIDHGSAQDIDPAPYFLSKWYRWQNPDHVSHDTILDHFVTAGARRIIDPSPFIDLTQFARKTGVQTSLDAYQSLFSGEYAGQDGVFKDYAELQRHQLAFLSNLHIDLLFDRKQSSPTRKRLVWVQIGPGSEFRNWFKTDALRDWDLVLNWYNFDAVDLSIGEFAFAQKGTKFTGLSQALKSHPDLFRDYEQILLLDDDLIFEFHDIDRLFSTAASNNLSVFQAGLTPSSHCIWPALRDKRASGVRRFNTVEIMMPGFSMEFLTKIAPVFDRTISGFGLDLAYGEIARNLGLDVGVLFDVRAQHLKPIDTADGAYYDYMRNSGINPKLELWQLIEEYNPSLEIKAI